MFLIFYRVFLMNQKIIMNYSILLNVDCFVFITKTNKNQKEYLILKNRPE